MSNYHLEVKTISRGKGQSVTRSISYITGRKLYDSYLDRTCYNTRSDVLYCHIFQPSQAPQKFCDLQLLCNEIECAEIRYDARTARTFIGSLPNELPLGEWVEIVRQYITDNFLAHNLCAVAAIHEGLNPHDPARNNPHVHIVVPTRTVTPEGFHSRKDREHDKRKYLLLWRERWACVQNQAYARNALSITVSHESLAVQGCQDREPTIHLHRVDWQKEQRGERTAAGDRKRAIQQRNRERDFQYDYEMELFP